MIDLGGIITIFTLKTSLVGLLLQGRIRYDSRKSWRQSSSVVRCAGTTPFVLITAEALKAAVNLCDGLPAGGRDNQRAEVSLDLRSTVTDSVLETVADGREPSARDHVAANFLRGATGATQNPHQAKTPQSCNRGRRSVVLRDSRSRADRCAN